MQGSEVRTKKTWYNQPEVDYFQGFDNPESDLNLIESRAEAMPTMSEADAAASHKVLKTSDLKRFILYVQNQDPNCDLALQAVSINTAFRIQVYIQNVHALESRPAWLQVVPLVFDKKTRTVRPGKACIDFIAQFQSSEPMPKQHYAKASYLKSRTGCLSRQAMGGRSFLSLGTDEALRSRLTMTASGNRDSGNADNPESKSRRREDFNAIFTSAMPQRPPTWD